MNTAIAVNASNTNPPVMSLVQDIPLNRIQESKTNPRRTFDEARLAELAANIRQHGVLQPVLVIVFLRGLSILAIRRSN